MHSFVFSPLYFNFICKNQCKLFLFLIRTLTISSISRFTRFSHFLFHFIPALYSPFFNYFFFFLSPFVMWFFVVFTKLTILTPSNAFMPLPVWLLFHIIFLHFEFTISTFCLSLFALDFSHFCHWYHDNSIFNDFRSTLLVLFLPS